MIKAYTLILFSVLFLVSCNKNEEIKIDTYSPKVVVEGSIENGNYASVLLSVSASMTGPMDTLSLLNHAIRSAKVTVSDGTNSEVLILQTNYEKIPPYEYIGTQLKGEIGKTYSLKIEYDDKVITGETYIPQPVPLTDIRFARIQPTDTTGYIHINFKNTTADFYQVETRVDSVEKIFTPCLYGNIDKSHYPKDEVVSMQINKGPTIFPKISFKTYFNASSTVLIKFNTMPEDGYKFWNSYQNEILNAENPIFPATTSLVSNIKGGIGLWCGYGSFVYKVKLADVEK